MKENTRDITSIGDEIKFDPKQITTDRVLAELPGFLTNQQLSWFNSLERRWQAEIIQGAKWDGLAATIKHIKWLFDRALVEMFDVPAEVLQDQTLLPDPPAAVQAVLNHSFPDPPAGMRDAVNRSFDHATETAKGRLQAQFDKLKRKGAK
jgi:hypothetical protein